MFSSGEKWRCLMPITMVCYLPLRRGREEAILPRLPSLLQCPGEQKGLFQHAGSFLILIADKRTKRKPELLHPAFLAELQSATTLAVLSCHRSKGPKNPVESRIPLKRTLEDH